MSKSAENQQNISKQKGVKMRKTKRCLANVPVRLEIFLTRILSYLIIHNANNSAQLFGLEHASDEYKGTTPVKIKNGQRGIFEFTLRMEP